MALPDDVQCFSSFWGLASGRACALGAGAACGRTSRSRGGPAGLPCRMFSSCWGSSGRPGCCCSACWCAVNGTSRGGSGVRVTKFGLVAGGPLGAARGAIRAWGAGFAGRPAAGGAERVTTGAGLDAGCPPLAGGGAVTLAARTGGAGTGALPANTAVRAGATVGCAITCALANCSGVTLTRLCATG
jgi:hypothetical protein